MVDLLHWLSLRRQQWHGEAKGVISEGGEPPLHPLANTKTYQKKGHRLGEERKAVRERRSNEGVQGVAVAGVVLSHPPPPSPLGFHPPKRQLQHTSKIPPVPGF